MADWHDDLRALEARSGLRFRQFALLEEAMTHRSYLNEHAEQTLKDNERLEFLGDAVLGFVVAEEIFRRFPGLPEGEMTPLRAALVRKETLARLGEEAGIDAVLRMSKGDSASGGARRPGVLSDAFEALVGAVYLDQGIDAVRGLVMPLVEPLLDPILADSLHKDARSALQEWSQAELGIIPDYITVGERGPDHAKEFSVEVRINGEVIGAGSGGSLKHATQVAARDALNRLRQPRG